MTVPAQISFTIRGRSLPSADPIYKCQVNKCPPSLPAHDPVWVVTFSNNPTIIRFTSTWASTLEAKFSGSFFCQPFVTSVFKGPPGDFGPKGTRGPKGPQGAMVRSRGIWLTRMK